MASKAIDKLTKNGYILNIFRTDIDSSITTSFYDKGGQLIELMRFSPSVEEDMDALSKYIELFKDNPEINKPIMKNIKSTNNKRVK